MCPQNPTINVHKNLYNFSSLFFFLCVHTNLSLQGVLQIYRQQTFSSFILRGLNFADFAHRSWPHKLQQKEKIKIKNRNNLLLLISTEAFVIS